MECNACKLTSPQEELIPFFSQVKLAPESNTAELAYLELAEKVSSLLVRHVIIYQLHNGCLMLSGSAGAWTQGRILC